MKDVNDTDRYLDSFAFGRFAHLALQRRMGLRAQRNSRNRPCDHRRSGIARPAMKSPTNQTILLAVFLSCALSIEFLPGGGSAMTSNNTEDNIDDANITAVVKSTLSEDTLTHLTHVNVDTHRGVVALNGLVEYSDQKERAEELARQVDGVRSVINNLAIISGLKANDGCCPGFSG
jgi:hypothetical protein